MRFPIVLRTRERFRAPSSLYYEVAANGIFQVRENEMYRAVTRVTRDVPGLLREHERAEIRFPRLSRAILEEVLAFFREVHARHRGEAIALLFYDPERREFRVRVPPQKISGYRDFAGQWWPRYHLEYESIPRPEGFRRFGTLHSHAGLPAYASAVDRGDERFEDGLHVVFGSFGSNQLSRSASFVANGARFDIDPDGVLEPCDVSARPPRADWLERVSCVEEPYAWSRRWGLGSYSWVPARPEAGPEPSHAAAGQESERDDG